MQQRCVVSPEQSQKMTVSLTRLTLFTLPAVLALSAIIIWAIWADNVDQREMIQECLVNISDQSSIKATVDEVRELMATEMMLMGLQSQVAILTHSVATREEIDQVREDLSHQRKRISDVEIKYFQAIPVDE